MSPKRSIPVSRLHEVLEYDPGTGILTWKPRNGKTRIERTWDGRYAGKTAGSFSSKGYLQFSIDGVGLKAHRVIWAMMTGEWPKDEIDHKDCNKGNNRWSNLREATSSQNAMNRRLRSDNAVGLKGVSWSAGQRAWIAQIMLDGQWIKLGTSDCPAAAHFSYLIAADVYFGEFARAA